jgi:hypothetical protein
MNGVHHQVEPRNPNEGRAYQGRLVNILTGEPVDQRVPIEQRAASLERSLAISALAEREGLTPLEATARYAGNTVVATEAEPVRLTVEEGLAAVISADAEAAANAVPVVTGAAQSEMATV